MFSVPCPNNLALYFTWAGKRQVKDFLSCITNTFCYHLCDHHFPWKSVSQNPFSFFCAFFFFGLFWLGTEKKQIHFLRMQKQIHFLQVRVYTILCPNTRHTNVKENSGTAQFQAIQESSRKSISKMKRNEITLCLINCKGFKSSIKHLHIFPVWAESTW